MVTLIEGLFPYLVDTTIGLLGMFTVFTCVTAKLMGTVELKGLYEEPSPSSTSLDERGQTKLPTILSFRFRTISYLAK